jgi:hypothetical protein
MERRIKVPWKAILAGGARGDMADKRTHPPMPVKRCPPVEQLALWSALQLARRRRYAEAETLLAPLRSSQPETRAQACDLLARMRVRQWRYADADSLWASASALAPDCCRYRRAREVLPLVPILWRSLMAAVIGILVLLAFAAGLSASRRGDSRPTETAPAPMTAHEALPQSQGGEQP